MTGNIKYVLCYDSIIGMINGKTHRRQGKQEISEPYNKAFCLAVAKSLCQIYGRDSHWVEDETGEKIEPEDRE